MKTILVLSLGASMAHVVRPLEVAKLLREMDYRVVFAGGGNSLQIARQAGFELRHLPEWDLDSLIAKIKNNSKVIHDPEQIDEWVKAELDLFTEVRPDVVLEDLRITCGISTAVAGIPRISIQNAYLNPNSARGLMDECPDCPRGIMDPGDEEPFNQVREKYGLPPVPSLPHMFDADLNLLCDIPEYAPMKTIPPNYAYVGPILWGNELASPEWLKDLDPKKPTLYLSMGSTGPQEIFLKAIETLSASDYQVMVTVGSRLNLDDVPGHQPSVFITSYADGMELVRYADALVCHGGNGTAYQALHAGIPIVSWPTVKDQHWNANRLSEIGVGLTVKSPEELLQTVDEILLNPGYREEALRFKERLVAYDGPRTAARLIHAYLGHIGS